MKANADKCHFICSSNQKANLTVENQEITRSACVKLLGVKIDFELTFNIHVNDICMKAEQKLEVRIIPSLGFDKKVIVECLFSFTISLLSFNMDVSITVQTITK